MSGRTAPKLRCVRCQTRLADPSKRIYSRFTRSHYCTDLAGCDRRAARTKRLARKTVAA